MVIFNVSFDLTAMASLHGVACFYWLKDATSGIFLLVEKCHRHLSTGGIFLLLQRINACIVKMRNAYSLLTNHKKMFMIMQSFSYFCNEIMSNFPIVDLLSFMCNMLHFPLNVQNRFDFRKSMCSC